MSDAELLAALEPHVRDGRLACRDALEVAAHLGVSPAQIGRLCDERGIRIVNCQLGCFGLRGKKG